MRHMLNMDRQDIEHLREVIFPAITRRDAILFLGAGASVSDKKFLSQQLMEYYAAKKGFGLTTDDIVEFVDTLSEDERFDRAEFDSFVGHILGKITVSDTHKTIVRLNWREIITSNVDLVMERAFDELRSTGQSNLKLKCIKRAQDYSYNPASDEVKYVKLNGCIGDLQKYPLVFSSQDFAKANRFYKSVMKSLENLSPAVLFISVGYSYSDPFGKLILKKFDSYNFRNRKWIINVDPYVQDSQLAYFSTNHIAVVKSSTDDFFKEYLAWEGETAKTTADRVRLRFTDRDNRLVITSPELKVRLNGVLTQLSSLSSFPAIDQISFYRGEEPTFDTIRRNHDVIRENTLATVKNRLGELLSQKHDLVPIVVLKGSYGTGKTTFAYRLAAEIQKDPSLDILSFEVLEPDRLRSTDLNSLFSAVKSRAVILLFNHIERDSAFKALIDLRVRLSAEQFPQVKLLMLGSIRENILERHKKQHSYMNMIEMDVDSSLTQAEASDLIEKLSAVNLVSYRDARRKKELISQITDKYKGDTFTSFVALLTNGQHLNYLLSAYNELPDKGKEAFLNTSLLYRFGTLMPASLLRRLISTDWDAFKRDVIEVDCKGIVIQEVSALTDTSPDLYFRTKHAIISDLLVKYFLSDEDQRFEAYLKLVRHLSSGFGSSTLLVDLLKSIRDTEDLSDQKVAKLYDACASEFRDDPHFTLHYAINLQHRGDEKSLREAIDRVLYVEGLLDRRNHRLIHRRATLNFHLARLIYLREKELDETLKYAREARDLFEVKMRLDPFSSYGYVDYVRFEMWYLDKIVLDDYEKTRQMAKIEDLLDLAEQSVFDDIGAVVKLKTDYLRNHRQVTPEDKKAYLDYLDSVYEVEKTRHLALILKFYYFQNEKDDNKCAVIADELMAYSHLDDAAKLLFKYYGRNLHLPKYRESLMKLARQNSRIEDRDPLNYHYFMYVAAAYNRYLEDSYGHVNDLRALSLFYNPMFHQTWRDAESGEEVIFGGILEKGANGRLRLRVIDLQQTFGFQLGNGAAVDLQDGTPVRTKLHFYLTGIRGEILS